LRDKFSLNIRIQHYVHSMFHLVQENLKDVASCLELSTMIIDGPKIRYAGTLIEEEINGWIFHLDVTAPSWNMKERYGIYSWNDFHQDELHQDWLHFLSNLISKMSLVQIRRQSFQSNRSRMRSEFLLPGSSYVADRIIDLRWFLPTAECPLDFLRDSDRQMIAAWIRDDLQKKNSNSPCNFVVFHIRQNYKV